MAAETETPRKAPDAQAPAEETDKPTAEPDAQSSGTSAGLAGLSSGVAAGTALSGALGAVTVAFLLAGPGAVGAFTAIHGVYPVLAAVLGALLGTGSPVAFDKRGSFLAALFGRRGRELAALIDDAGYPEGPARRYTHSLGALAVFTVALLPAIFFFGFFTGGAFVAGAALGFGIRLILEVAFGPAEERFPLLWPFTNPGRGPHGLLPAAHQPGTRTLRIFRIFRTGGGTGFAAAAIPGLLAAGVLLWNGGVRSFGELAEAATATAAGAPGEAMAFVAGHPTALGGVTLYGAGICVVAVAGVPKVYRRVARAARDDRSRRYTGGLESYALKPYSDARFGPRRFARVLSGLPLGDEGQVSFGYLVADEVRTVVSGRGIWEAAAALDAAYGDLTLVPLSPEEAWVLPPETHPAPDGEALPPVEHAPNFDGLVPVVVRYEVEGVSPELGILGLEDFDLKDTDPLSGPLTNLQNAVSSKDGERAMLLASIREAPAEDGEAAFLAQALGVRAQREEALKEDRKRQEEEVWRNREEERTRRYKESRRESAAGSRKGSSKSAGWEREADAALEAAAGGLLRAILWATWLPARLLWWVLKGFSKVLSKVISRSRTNVDDVKEAGSAGSKEREAQERRVIEGRLQGRAFCVCFEGVAYVRNGAGVEARVRRVEAAYDRFFAAYGRRGGAHLGRSAKSGAPGTQTATTASIRRTKSLKKRQLAAAGAELRLGSPFGGPAADGPVLTTDELAALLHPLGQEVQVHGREVASELAIPPPPAMTTTRMPDAPANAPAGAAGGGGSRQNRQSIEIAFSNHASYPDTAIELTFDELRTHGGITGGTGYGKSSLQYRIIESAWESGLGMALLDPKMDFFACVVSNLSKKRLKEAIIVDAGHEAPVPAYNLLVCPEKVDTAQRAATLLEGLKKRFPANAFQGRNSNYFMMSFRALIGANMARIRAGDKPGYVLPDLATGKFLAGTDDATNKRPYFRAEVLEHLEGTAEFEDVLEFFAEFDTLKRATQQEHVQSVTNKIGPLAGAQVRRFLGAPGQDFDMRTAIDEGLGIFLNLSKHVFPGGAAALVGTLFFSDIIAAAKARHWEATMRGTQNRMLDFLIAADEVQNFTCPEMVEILAEARAYRTPIWFGHQYAAQIKDEDLREAMAQAATHAYFNQTPKDAGAVAPILGDPFTKERLTNTPKFNFVIKAGEKIATCKTIPLPHTDPVRANEVRRASSARYASGEWAMELALPEEDGLSGEVPGARAAAAAEAVISEPNDEGVIEVRGEASVKDSGEAGGEADHFNQPRTQDPEEDGKPPIDAPTGLQSDRDEVVGPDREPNAAKEPATAPVFPTRITGPDHTGATESNGDPDSPPRVPRVPGRTVKGKTAKGSPWGLRLRVLRTSDRPSEPKPGENERKRAERPSEFPVANATASAAASADAGVEGGTAKADPGDEPGDEPGDGAETITGTTEAARGPGRDTGHRDTAHDDGLEENPSDWRLR